MAFKRDEPFITQLTDLSIQLCATYFQDWINCGTTQELLRGEDVSSIIEFRNCPRPRRPLNTPPVYHEAADEWFIRRFGIPYRSSSLFCTTHRATAEIYGEVRYVYPIGEYKICWSPNVYDMYLLANRGLPLTEFLKLLDHADYCEGSLHKALHSNCEIMVFCEAYISSSFLLSEK